MDRSARAALLGAVLIVVCLDCGCSRQGRERLEDAQGVGRAAAASPVGCRAPLGLDVVPVGDARSGSTVVMARVHGRLLAYVADEDASAVRILDVEALSELGSVAMPGRPARMLMLGGGRLAVTIRDAAQVAVFTPSPVGDVGLDALCSLETPDEPVDLAATTDGKTLLALSEWGHTLTGFDLDSGTPGFAVDLPRAPRAVLVSADGAHAYVAHAAGGAMSAVDLQRPLPIASSVDLAGESRRPETFAEMMPRPPEFEFIAGPVPGQTIRRRLTRPFVPPPPSMMGRSACQGFALAEVLGSSARVYAPMVEVATGDLHVQSSGYGAGESITADLAVMAIVDESSGKPMKDSLVAHEPRGGAPPPCLLPRAAVTAPGSLLVACMGIDAVVEYDTSTGKAGTHERRRWSVPSGPTGVAIHGSHAVVWSQFEGKATVLSLASDATAQPVALPVKTLASRVHEDEFALGRALFHATTDRRISRDGRACASCHPDGRDDGLVWSTPGGPRQTPMLAGRLPSTAPYGWDGAGSDVANHLGHTLARLEGEGLPKHEVEALVRYVTALEGPPVRPEPPGTLGDTPKPPGHLEGQLAQGRDVFFSAGCGSCHSAESAFTDGQSHKVGSHGPVDAVVAFDTPSLRFAGGTAPYFHDGRYATLRALLVSKNEPMGAARDRPPEDLDALEAFVRSL